MDERESRMTLSLGMNEVVEHEMRWQKSKNELFNTRFFIPLGNSFTTKDEKKILFLKLQKRLNRKSIWTRISMNTILNPRKSCASSIAHCLFFEVFCMKTFMTTVGILDNSAPFWVFLPILTFKSIQSMSKM